MAPRLTESSEARPFLPRTLIYKFVKSIAFSGEEKSRSMAEEWKAWKVVDEENLGADRVGLRLVSSRSGMVNCLHSMLFVLLTKFDRYDTWKVQKDEGEAKKYYLWVNRGKSLQRLRGIWHDTRTAGCGSL